MDNSTFPLKKDLRTAGLFYLAHIALVIYGVVFVSTRIGISGTSQMAGNIPANEFLFRTGIVSRLASMVSSLFLAFALYRILKK